MCGWKSRASNWPLLSESCRHGFCFHVHAATCQGYFWAQPSPTGARHVWKREKKQRLIKCLEEVSTVYLRPGMAARPVEICSMANICECCGVLSQQASLKHMCRATEHWQFLSAPGHDWTIFILSRFGEWPRPTNQRRGSLSNRILGQ